MWDHGAAGRWRPRTKTESTSAGEQHVIAGAEKVSDAEVAKRKTGEPLKPKVRQKPTDEGLFGDEANQTVPRRQALKSLNKRREPARSGCRKIHVDLLRNSVQRSMAAQATLQT